MVAKTRTAVVVTRPRARKRSRSRSNSYGVGKVSIAILMGFMPTLLEIVRTAQAGWSLRDIMSIPVYNYTGYSIPAAQWKMQGLLAGWGPVLAGYIAHVVANRFGINRAIGRLTGGWLGI